MKTKTPPERRKPMQKLQTVNAETLLYEPLEKPSFVVDSLIPTGLSLFCGSQKIGKSWLMLKLCPVSYTHLGREKPPHFPKGKNKGAERLKI